MIFSLQINIQKRKIFSLLIFGFPPFAECVNYENDVFLRSKWNDSSMSWYDLIFEITFKTLLKVSSLSDLFITYEALRFSQTLANFSADLEQFNFCGFPVQLPAYIFLLHTFCHTRCKICSKLTIKTPTQHHWRGSGVFIGNFEHISYLYLVFILLTLSK